MSEILVSAPPVEPVTVAEVKAQTVLEESEDDSLLAGFITAAREYVEDFIHRRLIQQTWQLRFDSFPSCGYFELPQAPAQSVTSITYTDAGQSPNVQTLSTDVYDLDSGVLPGVVFLQYNQVWPSNRNHRNDIVVTYVAGYAPSGSPLSQTTYAGNVPQRIKQAITMLCADSYRHRETKMPMQAYHNATIDNLLKPLKLYSL